MRFSDDKVTEVRVGDVNAEWEFFAPNGNRQHASDEAAAAFGRGLIDHKAIGCRTA